MRHVLVKWHGIRVLLGVCPRKGKVTAKPDEFDIAEQTDENVGLFWLKTSRWAAGLILKHPGWTFNGSLKVSRGDE